MEKADGTNRSEETIGKKGAWVSTTENTGECTEEAWNKNLKLQENAGRTERCRAWQKRKKCKDLNEKDREAEKKLLSATVLIRNKANYFGNNFARNGARGVSKKELVAETLEEKFRIRR